MKGNQRPTSEALANNHHEYTSPVKYTSGSRKHAASRPIDEDDEWMLDTPKRRPPRASSFSEKKNAQNTAAIENVVDRIIRSVAEESTSSQVTSSPAVRANAQTSPIKKTTTTPTATTTVTPSVPVSTPPPPPQPQPQPQPQPANTVKINDAKSASESSPIEKSRRLAATKRDSEKRKQVQVKNARSFSFDWL